MCVSYWCLAACLCVLRAASSRSDKMSRVRLLKMDLVFWTLGLALLIISILLDNLPLLFVGMALWAPCSQCWNSASAVDFSRTFSPRHLASPCRRFNDTSLPYHGPFSNDDVETRSDCHWTTAAVLYALDLWAAAWHRALLPPAQSCSGMN